MAKPILMSPVLSASANIPPLGQLLQYWRKNPQLQPARTRDRSECFFASREFCRNGAHQTKPQNGVASGRNSVGATAGAKRTFVAPGFAPVFRESSLDDPQLAPVRNAIDVILHQQEPYAAVAMNRRWDIITSNEAGQQFFAKLLDGRTFGDANTKPNVLRLMFHLMFHPMGLRPTVINWSEVAQGLLQRLYREAVGGVLDEPTRSVLSEILDYPDVSAGWRTPDLNRPLLPVLPVCFKLDDTKFNYFSAVTVLGTPQDVTLQELRIESFSQAMTPLQ